MARPRRSQYRFNPHSPAIDDSVADQGSKIVAAPVKARKRPSED
jgi:hypothetical protein